MAPASEPSSAAEMLSIALQANPDLLVARAKVAEAEAELRRVQLDVARRVIRQRQELENQKAKVARIEKLHASKAATAEDLSEAANELSALETELQYLLGRSPELPGGLVPGGIGFPGMPGMSPPGASSMMMPGMGGSSGTMSRWSGTMGTSRGGGGTRSGTAPSAPGKPLEPAAKGDEAAMQERVSKSLNAKISLKVENAPLHDVIKRLQEAGEVKFVVNTVRLSQAGVPLDLPITVDVEDMPLSAVLHLIEDIHPPLTFAYREYGILVTEGGDAPAGPMGEMMKMMRGGRPGR